MKMKDKKKEYIIKKLNEEITRADCELSGQRDGGISQYFQGKLKAYSEALLLMKNKMSEDKILDRLEDECDRAEAEAKSYLFPGTEEIKKYFWGKHWAYDDALHLIESYKIKPEEKK